ncbi:DDE_3 domain-containing protein [Trichonephila clavipes]|nr:DDE_3 domain-containing protein [Trichonephila clavipes]
METPVKENDSYECASRHLHKQNICGSAAIPKSLVTDGNAKRCVYSGVTLTKHGRLISGKKTPAQAYDRNCLSTVQQEDGPVMIWAAVSWFSAEIIIVLKGKITREKYREVSADQVHPMRQTLFPAEYGIFQEDNAPIHGTGLIQSLLMNMRKKFYIYLDSHCHPT